MLNDKGYYPRKANIFTHVFSKKEPPKLHVAAPGDYELDS